METLGAEFKTLDLIAYLTATVLPPYPSIELDQDRFYFIGTLKI